MKFDKNQSAGYLANHMARLFAQGLQARIKHLGLAPAQFMTLLALWQEDGLTQRQLIERLDVEQATMANTLARMVRDGLIERRPHPEDGRAQVVCLTAKARADERQNFANWYTYYHRRAYTATFATAKVITAMHGDDKHG